MKFTAITAAAFLLATSVFASESRMDRHANMKRVPAAGGPTDVEILNYALTLEYLERDFYAMGLAKFQLKDFKAAGFSRKVYERFVTLAGQEKTHVAFLSSALGSSAVKECQYSFGLTDVKSFLFISLILEGVGTSAYLGAAPDITEAAYLSAAGAILTVEARHSSYLNEINGLSGFPSPYDAALTYSQVYTLASQFIVPGSCPAGGPLPAGIHAFPKLTVKTASPKAGHKCGLHFPLKSGVSSYYVAFINGLTTTIVAIDNSNGVVEVPAALAGLGATYVVITSSSSALTEANTIAGPAVMIL